MKNKVSAALFKGEERKKTEEFVSANVGYVYSLIKSRIGRISSEDDLTEAVRKCLFDFLLEEKVARGSAPDSKEVREALASRAEALSREIYDHRMTFAGPHAEPYGDGGVGGNGGTGGNGTDGGNGGNGGTDGNGTYGGNGGNGGTDGNSGTFGAGGAEVTASYGGAEEDDVPDAVLMTEMVLADLYEVEEASVRKDEAGKATAGKDAADETASGKNMTGNAPVGGSAEKVVRKKEIPTPFKVGAVVALAIAIVIGAYLFIVVRNRETSRMHRICGTPKLTYIDKDAGEFGKSLRFSDGSDYALKVNYADMGDTEQTEGIEKDICLDMAAALLATDYGLDYKAYFSMFDEWLIDKLLNKDEFESRIGMKYEDHLAKLNGYRKDGGIYSIEVFLDISQKLCYKDDALIVLLEGNLAKRLEAFGIDTRSITEMRQYSFKTTSLTVNGKREIDSSMTRTMLFYRMGNVWYAFPTMFAALSFVSNPNALKEGILVGTVTDVGDDHFMMNACYDLDARYFISESGSHEVMVMTDGQADVEVGEIICVKVRGIAYYNIVVYLNTAEYPEG